MSEDLVTRVSASSGSRDDGTSGHLLQQLTGTVPSPSDFVSAPGEEAPSDRSTRGRRTRAPRVVTNVSVVGEKHVLPSCDEVECSLLEEADSIWCSSAGPKVPQTYSESLELPERKQWSSARQAERDGLERRGVMEVKPIPTGVTPLKSKYVFALKRNKEGAIQRYKARLVVLGCGDHEGDRANNYAPVVKAITVRLLLTIAFVKNMVFTRPCRHFNYTHHGQRYYDLVPHVDVLSQYN